MESDRCTELGYLIQQKFFEININFKHITNHISYDTEENCNKNNNGKWTDRLK